jgi:hypothetical protein
MGGRFGEQSLLGESGAEDIFDPRDGGNVVLKAENLAALLKVRVRIVPSSLPKKQLPPLQERFSDEIGVVARVAERDEIAQRLFGAAELPVRRKDLAYAEEELAVLEWSEMSLAPCKESFKEYLCRR